MKEDYTKTAKELPKAKETEPGQHKGKKGAGIEEGKRGDQKFKEKKRKTEVMRY